MLQQHRYLRVQEPDFVEKSPIVEAAQAWPDLVQMHGQTRREQNIFGMTRLDPGAEFGEAVAQKGPVVEIALRAGDQVDRIEVDRESRTVDGLDQLQITIRTLRKGPGHG